MIDTTSIRNKVLELAMQGKLTEQLSEDGNAEDLYAAIHEEKDRLIKEKKLKKSKALPEIREDDIPYEIPDNWKWVRIEDITYSVGNKNNQILAKDIKETGAIPAVSQGAVFIDGYSDDLDKVINDLPVIMFGDHTRNVKYVDFPFVICADGTKFMKPIKCDGRYIYYVLLYFAETLRNRGYARHYSLLRKEVLPMPPFEEQLRIEKKITDVFELLDTIDELQSAYSSDLEVLKSKIIDAGIQGKLTEQLQEDGNAEDLYAVIQEEKERLIKEKTIKKSKALPEITEEEIPFEIPNNWKWVRLVDLCKQVTDGTHKTPHYTVKGIPFLSVKDISSGFIDFSDTKFISSEEHDQLLKRCKPEKSDILFCRIGTLGKAIEIDTDIQFSIFVSLGLIKPIEKRITRYLVYVLNSGYGYGWIKLHKAGDSMHAAKINLDMLRTFPVPIPPIEEMDRIVDKVNMILDMI